MIIAIVSKESHKNYRQYYHFHKSIHITTSVPNMIKVLNYLLCLFGLCLINLFVSLEHYHCVQILKILWVIQSP
jgi:hypothetical protein